MNADQRPFSLPLSDRQEPAPGTDERPGLPTVQPAALPAPLLLPVAPPVSSPVLPQPAPSPDPMLSPSARFGDAPSAPVAPPEGGGAGIVRLDRASVSGADRGIELDELLLHLLEEGGSDLHLTLGAPPMVRIHGDLERVAGFGPLTGTQLQDCLYSILTERQKQRFEELKELDLAYELPGAARFRVNLFLQRGTIGGVLRAIPWEIKALEALNMPPSLAGFAALPRGLVLVTGPTGSGKSTTLAAIIDKANRTRKAHIMTIEDPVEFVHQHRLSVVNQREVGDDTLSFNNALKHALRQDPDIILVGEMRDLETISIALTAAETGHLVFGTLHTSSAGSTIDRIIDVFPSGQQSQIRTQVAASLQAVVCQTLCKTADGKGRVAATEVLIATPAVRNLIREAKLQSIPSAMQTGSKFGMHTLNQNLAELVEAGTITYDVAREKCSDASELHQLLGMSDNAAE
jgi:twitching motility protein PilT